MYYSMQDQSRSNLTAKFEKFQQNIVLSTDQREKIAGAHKQLQSLILQHFPYVYKTALVGAYANKTMLKPWESVDVFVYIDPQYIDLTPNSVLKKLNTDLIFSFPECAIKANKSCVALPFVDCLFDLTPCVVKNNGHFIPDSDGNCWLAIEDPVILQQKLGEANILLAGLMAMIKVWQRKHRHSALTSFEMEQLAVSMAPFDGYREGLEKLLTLFGWQDRIYSEYQLQRMDNYQFADYCSGTLFGDCFSP
jgi:hypothetical protein